jgi:two-component system cell cycle sensor histidine kinase/response regulator CckA
MAKVLAVEDEALVRLLLVEALEEAGHQVFEAPDGEAALGVIDRIPDLDAIVTDIRMPRLDGFGLAMAARRKRPDLPLVFMTGYSDAAVPDALKDIETLHKPFDPQRIVIAVEQALRGKSR